LLYIRTSQFLCDKPPPFFAIFIIFCHYLTFYFFATPPSHLRDGTNIRVLYILIWRVCLSVICMFVWMNEFDWSSSSGGIAMWYSNESDCLGSSRVMTAFFQWRAQPQWQAQLINLVQICFKFIEFITDEKSTWNFLIKLTLSQTSLASLGCIWSILLDSSNIQLSKSSSLESVNFASCKTFSAR